MDRAKEWNVELINRFPLIDIDGVSATAKLITILEEMGGFENGANLHYDIITHDVHVYLGSACVIYPIYCNTVQLRCIFNPTAASFSIKLIDATSTAIRDFLSTHWSEIFPKESA